MIVVSSIDSNYAFASTSDHYLTNYGNPIGFCGPGVNIACSGKDGSLVHVTGTSYAAAICAGVAALVWGANPNLVNTQVESIMISSCKKLVGFCDPNTGSCFYDDWNPYAGYGLPDAEKAVKIAQGK